MPTDITGSRLTSCPARRAPASNLGTAKAKWRQQSLAVLLSDKAPGTPGQIAYGCVKPAAAAVQSKHTPQHAHMAHVCWRKTRLMLPARMRHILHVTTGCFDPDIWARCYSCVCGVPSWPGPRPQSSCIGPNISRSTLVANVFASWQRSVPWTTTP